MDRIGRVFYQDVEAGILKRTNNGFNFKYAQSFLCAGVPLSFNLPLQEASFFSEDLFPFFQNLASEGWMRRVQSVSQKINESDSFELLIENGHDLIGAVTIEPLDDHE